MKNLNKFTKAELISKFKKLESKNSNHINISNVNLFTRVIEFISWFKGLIFKLTLIAMLIKTFKKYSLFARLLRFANWIILSIFGISLIDNFGLDFFKNFIIEIRTILAGIIIYFSNTHFYSFIASLFKTKEEITTRKISIREEPMSWENTRNESEIKQSKGNSKISEWLKPEPEIEENNNNTKYYIIAGLVIACLGWYYFDEIKNVTPFVMDWFRRIRPGNDGDGTGNNGLNRGNIQSSISNIKTNVEQKFSNIFNKDVKSDVTDIELVDKTQNIASTSKVTLDSSPSTDNSMNHYFTKQDEIIEPQLTGLKPITGQDFTGESTAVLNEIDTFLKYNDNASFPKAVVGVGFYKLLRDRLAKLADFRRSSYEQLIENKEVNNKIEKFLNLENQFYSPHVEETTLNNQTNLDNQNVIETQSDTYEEVAVANIESRIAWSDRATPSIHSQVLSPVSVHDNLDNNLDNLIENADNLDNTELMNKVAETFGEQINLSNEIKNPVQQTSSQVLPEIDIDSGSSHNSSMNQFFTKPEVEEEVKPKYTFTDLLNSIKSRRDDSNVVGSPDTTQLGLSPRLSPLNTKPSISNLFDDTTALFDDVDDEVIPSISNIDKGKAKEVDDNLLSTVSNPWENVVTNIQYGDSDNNIIVDLNYGDLWTRISKYRFVMNTGQIIDYDYDFEGDVVNKTRTFDLTSKIESTEQVDIKEIILLDLNHRGNSVWKNTKFYS